MHTARQLSISSVAGLLIANAGPALGFSSSPPMWAPASMAPMSIHHRASALAMKTYPVIDLDAEYMTLQKQIEILQIKSRIRELQVSLDILQTPTDGAAIPIPQELADSMATAKQDLEAAFEAADAVPEEAVVAMQSAADAAPVDAVPEEAVVAMQSAADAAPVDAVPEEAVAAMQSAADAAPVDAVQAASDAASDAAAAMMQSNADAAADALQGATEAAAAALSAVSEAAAQAVQSSADNGVPLAEMSAIFSLVLAGVLLSDFGRESVFSAVKMTPPDATKIDDAKFNFATTAGAVTMPATAPSSDAEYEAYLAAVGANGGMRDRSAPSILFGGAANLLGAPLGWIYGGPTALTSGRQSTIASVQDAVLGFVAAYGASELAFYAAIALVCVVGFPGEFFNLASDPALAQGGLDAYDALTAAEAFLPLRAALALTTTGWAHEAVVMPLEKWATQLNYAEPRVENDFVNGDTSRSAVVRTVAAMPLSYIGWEAAFWASVAAVGLVGYPKEFFGIEASEEIKSLSVQAFEFLSAARTDPQTRLGLALLSAPWVSETILDNAIKYIKALTYSAEETVAEAEALAASGAVPEPVFTSGRVVSTLTGSEDPKSASVPVPVAVGGGPLPVSYEEYLDYRRAIALR
jgi:hypothetical protein